MSAHRRFHGWQQHDQHQAWDEAAQDELDRMHRAHGRGTGCYLTAEMIQSLALTAIGEIWSDERPTAPYPPRSTFERDFAAGRPRKKHGRGNISAPELPQNARIYYPSSGVSLGERREHFTATLPGFP
jgi:hypothetical protein